MTERVEQQICIKFYIKLEHCCVETIQMIQKATAMGNWWLAASSQQHTRSCITSHAVFWWDIKSPRWLTPLQSRFGALLLLAVPKTKIPLKGKSFQTVNEIQENTMEQLMAIGRIVWGPKVPALKRAIVLSNVPLCICTISCSSYYQSKDTSVVSMSWPPLTILQWT